MAKEANRTVFIEFKPKGDKGLVAAINAINKAQIALENKTKTLKASGKQIIEGNKKVAASYLRMEVRMKSAGASMKSLAVSEKTLAAARKGDVVALEKLRIAYAKYNKTSGMAVQGNRILGGSFAVLRSKLLLFNFAMALGIKQLLDFTVKAAKLKGMETAFNTLQGSVNGGAVAIEKLRKATDGTMSSFDLFQQANNAMILGVTKNSDEMAEMFDIAQRLGRALGKDTAMSVESLITGIGRQSRLMLDNIGIIVKSEEAYVSYAQKLGKTSEELTDTERKQAFLNATMESARAKVKMLGDEELNNIDIIQQLFASLSDLAVALGELIAPVVIEIAEGFKYAANFTKEFFNALSEAMATESRFKDFDPFEKFTASAKTLTKEGLINKIGELQSRLLEISKPVEEVSKNIRNTANSVEEFAGEVSLSLVPIEESNTALKLWNDSLTEGREGIKLIVGAYEDKIKAAQSMTKAMEDSGKMVVSFDNEIAELNVKIAILTKLLNSIPEPEIPLTDYEKWLKTKTELGEKTKQELGFTKRLIAENRELAEILGMVKSKIDIWGIYNQQISNTISAIDTMNNAEISQARERELRNAEGIANEERRRKRIDDINKKYDAIARQRANQLKIWKVASAISNVALGITQTYSDPTIPTPFKFPLAIMMGLQGLAQIKTIEAQKYAKGGEFVTNQPEMIMVGEKGREHVKITPIDRPVERALGSSSINISFSGNVLSQDFIEEQAIPQIKDALRRGADLGIA